jgi:competence protein CoiA
MQLYAFDENQRLVLSRQAIKQRDYFCIECQQVVRVRGGYHRQAHYYHTSPVQSCHLSKKSMAHLQVQNYLQSIFPDGECLLEHPFPAINRIADVVWTAQKMVFEVQCSPISRDEILARNRDYTSQGFQVVWILHDNRYNQWRVSAAEITLKNSPFYFTNIDADGKGIIYDQYDSINKGLRKKLLGPLAVAMHERHSLNADYQSEIGNLLPGHQQWPFCFSGDLLHLCCVTKDASILEKIKYYGGAGKQGIISTCLSIGLCMIGTVKRLHALFLKILLERACR